MSSCGPKKPKTEKFTESLPTMRIDIDPHCRPRPREDCERRQTKEPSCRSSKRWGQCDPPHSSKSWGQCDSPRSSKYKTNDQCNNVGHYSYRSSGQPYYQPPLPSVDRRAIEAEQEENRRRAEQLARQEERNRIREQELARQEESNRIREQQIARQVDEFLQANRIVAQMEDVPKNQVTKDPEVIRRSDSADNDVPVIPNEKESVKNTPQCAIYLDSFPTVLIEPCGHLCLCDGCLKTLENAKNDLKNCPLCRGAIEKKRTLFVA